MKNIINPDYIKTFDEKVINTKKPIEDIVNAFIAKYANKMYFIKSEKDENETYVILMQRKGMFTRVPGLKSFVYAKIAKQESGIKAESGVLFETDSGLQTSIMVQTLMKSSIFIDPVPLPMLPRYDKILFSVIHKAVIDRNIGIAVRTGLFDDIFRDIRECSSITVS